MRILAGEYKGRKLLPPPRGADTRPITGAVKESLFGMLGGRVVGAVVLDLYCGTGTIGLEALSRGAAFCAFAERDRRVIARLRRNLRTCGAAESSAVWSGDLTRHLHERLASLPDPVTLAFVDPPYASAAAWDWSEAGTALFAPLAGRLADDGRVVLRTPGGLDVPDAAGGLDAVRRRHYGDMDLTFFGPPDGGPA